MQRSLLIFLFFVSAAVAACASQGAPGGGGGSTDVVVLNGCRVDPARICDNIRGKSVDMSRTGLQADPADGRAKYDAHGESLRSGEEAQRRRNLRS